MTLNRSNLTLGTSTTTVNQAWENEIKSQINHISQNAADSDAVFYQVQGFQPYWTSNTTLIVGPGAWRDSTGVHDMVRTTSGNISTATIGSLGMLQTANLTGTVTTTSGSVTVTGSGTSFLTDFVIGDVIFAVGANQARRITGISSNTALTVESNFSITSSGQNYRRGGLAPNTMYHLYTIKNTGTNTTSFGLATRDSSATGGQTLPSSQLPSGFTVSRMLPCWVITNSSSQILPFSVVNWGSATPELRFSGDYRMQQTTATNVLASGSQTNLTDVDLTNFLPSYAQSGRFHLTNSTAATIQVEVVGKIAPSTNTLRKEIGTNELESTEFTLVDFLGSGRLLRYRNIGAGGGSRINLVSGIVTHFLTTT